MATVLRRMPPPPPLTQDPLFNRWLHDLTSFILSVGGIDTSQISGFTSLQSTVSTNSANITTLQSQMSTANSDITTLQNQMSTADSNITTLQNQVAALQTNPIVRNGSGAPASSLGNNGDWYADTTGSVIYVKVSGAWNTV